VIFTRVDSSIEISSLGSFEVVKGVLLEIGRTDDVDTTTGWEVPTSATLPWSGVDPRILREAFADLGVEPSSLPCGSVAHRRGSVTGKQPQTVGSVSANVLFRGPVGGVLLYF
jgi:hypothetical protein